MPSSEQRRSTVFGIGQRTVGHPDQKLTWQEFTSDQNACIFRDLAVDPELIRTALLSCLISSISARKQIGGSISISPRASAFLRGHRKMRF